MIATTADSVRMSEWPNWCLARHDAIEGRGIGRAPITECASDAFVERFVARPTINQRRIRPSVGGEVRSTRSVRARQDLRPTWFGIVRDRHSRRAVG